MSLYLILAPAGNPIQATEDYNEAAPYGRTQQYIVYELKANRMEFPPY